MHFVVCLKIKFSYLISCSPFEYISGDFYFFIDSKFEVCHNEFVTKMVAVSNKHITEIYSFRGVDEIRGFPANKSVCAVTVY